jgi:hypothetical protein
MTTKLIWDLEHNISIKILIYKKKSSLVKTEVQARENTQIARAQHYFMAQLYRKHCRF